MFYDRDIYPYQVNILVSYVIPPTAKGRVMITHSVAVCITSKIAEFNHFILGKFYYIVFEVGINPHTYIYK